ncbi:MAG: transcriptional regulator-like protein [Verrucomicrobiales bacterium]|nr:transcriptional regulator-like protein [Verrucomicrobiales bacterium]
MAPKGKNKTTSKLERRMTRWDQSCVDHIHERIYNKTYPTLKSLAAELKTSTDTVLRNIRYMTLYKNLPIDFSRKLGKVGYYYSKPVSARIGKTFNEQEVLNFLIGHRAIETLPVKRHQKRLGLGFEKISQLLDPRTEQLLEELKDTVYFRPFAPEEIDIETFMIISEGIRKRHPVKFSYTKHMAELPELKTVYPYCFTCAANAWYLIAWDPTAKDYRTYLLSRADCATITEGKFKKPKNFNLDDHLDGAFIIMKGKESHDVVIEFDRWAAAYIRNRRFTRDQKVEELANGGLRISMHLTCLEEVEAWIGYWRTHARAVSPAPLVNRLHDYGQYLIKAHPRVEDHLIKADSKI